jgi:hypothetical protein
MCDEDRALPVVQNDVADEVPSCSPKIYISNEEAALLAGMRSLREQSAQIRGKMATAGPDERSRLESEVETLRLKWKDLAAQRERAFTRKMIMLGHLPPDYPIE